MKNEKKEANFFLGLICLLACLLLVRDGNCESSPAPEQPLSFVSTVSFQSSKYGVPLVQVRLNDKTTATFAIDTGANYNVMTDELARKLALTPQTYPSQEHPILFEGQNAQAVALSRTQVGTLPFGNLTYLIISKQRQSYLLGESVDGVIGIDWFQHFALALDFPKHQISFLAPGGLTSQAVANLGFELAQSVAMKQSPASNLYSLPFVLTNGPFTINVDLQLDTGTPVISLTKEQAKQLHLKPQGQEQNVELSGGGLSYVRSIVPSLMLGNVVYKNYPVIYSARENASFVVVGTNVFAKDKVLFDFPGSKMYVQSAHRKGSKVCVQLNISFDSERTAFRIGNAR